MRIRLNQIFFIALSALAVCNITFAQDAGMDVEIVDDRDMLDKEKMLYSPGDGGVFYSSKTYKPSLRDTVASHLPESFAKLKVEKKVKPLEKQASKPAEDDSILSFNFLYYIIQKYKLQDIID